MGCPLECIQRGAPLLWGRQSGTAEGYAFQDAGVNELKMQIGHGYTLRRVDRPEAPLTRGSLRVLGIRGNLDVQFMVGCVRCRRARLNVLTGKGALVGLTVCDLPIWVRITVAGQVANEQ